MKINGLYNKYHKDTFEKISEERRERIYEVAINEFALNGFNGANINVIAKKAEISVGSLYNYFASKEDLYLSIANKVYLLLESVINEIASVECDFFTFLEKLLRASKDYAKKYPQMNQIYLDMTTQSLASLSNRLSTQIESITAKVYREALSKAKQDGSIREAVEDNLAAFCIDNLIVMFQFSFTSDYYKERMKIFIGKSDMNDEESLIKGVLEFIRKALM